MLEVFSVKITKLQWKLKFYIPLLAFFAVVSGDSCCCNTDDLCDLLFNLWSLNKNFKKLLYCQLNINHKNQHQINHLYNHLTLSFDSMSNTKAVLSILGCVYFQISFCFVVGVRVCVCNCFCARDCIGAGEWVTGFNVRTLKQHSTQMLTDTQSLVLRALPSYLLLPEGDSKQQFPAQVGSLCQGEHRILCSGVLHQSVSASFGPLECLAVSGWRPAVYDNGLWYPAVYAPKSLSMSK